MFQFDSLYANIPIKLEITVCFAYILNNSHICKRIVNIFFKARDYKITNLPKYAVGLSHKEVQDVQKEKLLAKEASEQAYQKLTAMKKCMKVFNKKFINRRFLPDPYHPNSIDNHTYLRQEYNLSSNDIFRNLYEHGHYQY